jgi:hypothetical protein
VNLVWDLTRVINDGCCWEFVPAFKSKMDGFGWNLSILWLLIFIYFGIEILETYFGGDSIFDIFPYFGSELFLDYFGKDLVYLVYFYFWGAYF